MMAGDVVSAVAAARKAVQLYPPSHPAHAEALDALVGAVDVASREGALVLNLHEGQLYSGSMVIPEDVHGASAIADAFETRCIESLSLSAGFGSADALALTEVLSLRPSPDLDVESELSDRGARAIAVSFLKDDDEDEREERDRQRQADRAMYHRALATLRKWQQQFSAGGAADVSGTDEFVENVVQRMLADPSAVMGLATIRGAGERNLFHSLNVMIYSLALAQRLGLPEEGLVSLGLSALLHDVGKTAFVEGDPSQAEAMRVLHPTTGAEILQRVGLEDPAPMLVAYEHHMCADGSGWPERPADYVPHPYTRMIAIADRFENLTNPRDGGDALTPDRALVQVLREGTTTLDPFFSRLFANALGAFPVGCLVRLSDMSVAVVSRTGEDPLAPVVRLAYDRLGFDITESDDVDLASSELRIVEVIDPDSLNMAVADKL